MEQLIYYLWALDINLIRPGSFSPTLIPDSNVGWPNVGTIVPTSGRSWANQHCCLGYLFKMLSLTLGRVRPSSSAGDVLLTLAFPEADGVLVLPRGELLSLLAGVVSLAFRGGLSSILARFHSEMRSQAWSDQQWEGSQSNSAASKKLHN